MFTIITSHCLNLKCKTLLSLYWCLNRTRMVFLLIIGKSTGILVGNNCTELKLCGRFFLTILVITVEFL